VTPNHELEPSRAEGERARCLTSTASRVEAAARSVFAWLQGAAHGRPPRHAWRIHLRRAVAQRRLGQALRRRIRGRSGFLPAALPESVPLLDFSGERSLPLEIRDDRLIADVIAWRQGVEAAEEIRAMPYRPLISVLMPAIGSEAQIASAAVESLLAQIYPEWELCVVDDGYTLELRAPLAQTARGDSRIRLVTTDGGRTRADAKNEALQLARGEFVAMLDPEDELLPDALLEVARRLNAQRDLDLVYTDESCGDEDGGGSRECMLKPDWSPTLLWGVMYVGRLLVVRRSLVLAVGGFDPAFESIEDYELVLRVAEATDRVEHVPRVLYRTRRLRAPEARSGDARRRSEELQSRAVSAHLRRLGINARAEPHPRYPHRMRLVPIDGPPSPASTVSAVVAAEGRAAGDVAATLDSLSQLEGRRPAEVVVWRRTAPQNKDVSNDVRVRAENGTLAAALSTIGADFVLYIEAGYVAEGDEWLAHLLLHAQRERVGVVAPLVLGRDGVEERGLDLGRTDPLVCAREAAAIAGACAIVSRRRLEELGGVSPLFAIARYAWIEFSLRARHVGLRTVVTPQAVARRVRAERRGGAAEALDLDLVREIWEDVAEQ
jgi:hypothetical protein